jgi:hypothetical protein|uniref:Uncharacterized protein n=1 Tax=Sipha flava TaxID=143950 RepID=A0A2S2QUM6_9HEMI
MCHFYIYNCTQCSPEFIVLNSSTIFSILMLFKLFCSTNNSNSDSSLSCHIVFLSLVFTMVNFENVLSQLQLVTGIVEKSIKTFLKFGKMSPFKFSFKNLANYIQILLMCYLEHL